LMAEVAAARLAMALACCRMQGSREAGKRRSRKRREALTALRLWKRSSLLSFK
jgi:hypothetical protein